MTLLESALQNLAHYPRWFVTLCVVIVGAAAIWVLAKLLKWTLYLAVLAVLGVGALALVVWWMR
jgi:hypothetical protein